MLRPFAFFERTLDTVLSPFASWLAALLCLLIVNGGPNPGLDEYTGTWVSPDATVQVAWDPAEFEASTDLAGRLLLAAGASRGTFSVVPAESALACVQRAVLEISVTHGALFLDLSLAERPHSAPGVTAGLYQFLGQGGQQIAYVECRPLPATADAGTMLSVAIVAQVERWSENLEQWSSVLAAIEVSDPACAC